ncbi:MAG TPA: hypothetical protein QGG59_05660 [Planctomycetota bacterium]|jgi:tetratricopeptide (TPR) repeat protein|nr:hypothetical protein [Planctomycetota bacterium]HJM39583.1 hypothetical protein [Planctomycetota bacterium]|tara:strand:- start:5068 stop:6414 length:1347 start_codon:yes stop_codon:yes gene_type:complete
MSGILLAPIALFLLQSGDAAELTQKGLKQLQNTEVALAAGKLKGLEVTDSFFQAASTLRKACKAGGAEANAYEGLSRALMACNDIRNSIKAAEDGLDLHPNEITLQLQLAKAYMASAQELSGKKQTAAREQARSVLEDAVAQHKKRSEPCVRLGETLIFLGDKEAAIESWQLALKRDPSTVDFASLPQWLGGVEAASLIEAHMNTVGEDPLLSWHLGMAHYAALPGSWKACKKTFLRTMELEPSYTSCWYYLANAAFFVGQRYSAEEKTREATKEYRFAAHAWSQYLTGPGGASHLQAAAAEGGDAIIADMKWLAGTAFANRDAKTAAGISRWLVQARPKDPEAWNNLAFFLRETNEAEESLAAYRNALKLQPDDPQVMNDLAVILHYYLQRDKEEAIDLYIQAAQRAEEILMDTEGMEADEISRIKTALRDATKNLKKLKAGSLRPN